MYDAPCADTVNISITRCSSSRSHPHPSLPLRLLPSFFLSIFVFHFVYRCMHACLCKTPPSIPSICWQGVVLASCLLLFAVVSSVALLCLRSILPALSFNCFPPRLRRISNCFSPPIVFRLQFSISSAQSPLILKRFSPPLPPLPSLAQDLKRAKKQKMKEIIEAMETFNSNLQNGRRLVKKLERDR